jgi:hypothetical protein
MSRKKGKHRRSNRGGHYCWVCDQILSNERFSGKGRRRHVCQDCAKLGEDELAVLQEIRNLDRLVTDEGRIPRRSRVQFRKYMEHANERVRAHAMLLWIVDQEEKREERYYDNPY